MKVLRVFFIRNHSHRTIWCERKNCTEHRWSKEQLSRDFPQSMSESWAMESLYKEYGFPPEKVDYQYPPEQFVRIQSSTVCEDTPERGKVEEVRTSEVDLFSGLEMKKALSTKPERK